jgi:hypothetical protein
MVDKRHLGVEELGNVPGGAGRGEDITCAEATETGIRLVRDHRDTSTYFLGIRTCLRG